MKGKHITKIVLWIIFTLLTVYICFNGLIYNYNVILDGAYNARLGIDLKGGMHAILTPDTDETISNSDLDSAIEVINMRLDGQGIFDRSVMADYENKRVIVEIPWATGETEFNPQKITEELGDTAELTFKAATEDSTEESGYKLGEDVLVYGENVTNAYPATDDSGNYVVALEFDSKGTEAFKNATTQQLGKPLAIIIDDQIVSAPNVDTVITNGKATISGDFTYEQAKSLANKIKSGKLPFSLEISDGELRTITPILGENALAVAMQAGAVALIVVLLFMILYYRLPGVISAIALIAHIALQVLLMVWFKSSITLPGIAGIVLTIGMSVDANIIVFERMKEEISKGKDITATIRDGFKNALSAIIDGNLTTILTAFVLLYFGTGSIKGFAITLIIGIALNFITGIWMTKSLLIATEKSGLCRNIWWYGAKKHKKEEVVQ